MIQHSEKDTLAVVPGKPNPVYSPSPLVGCALAVDTKYECEVRTKKTDFNLRGLFS